MFGGIVLGSFSSPCVEMLEPTLFQLYTGQIPRLVDGCSGGVDPDQFFGSISNAKYLLLERLTQQCADALAELIRANKHESLVSHPGFGPDLLSASSMRIFNELHPNDYTKEDLRERVLVAACKWLDTDDEDSLSQTLLFKTSAPWQRRPSMPLAD